jgi:hypothetical protein
VFPLLLALLPAALAQETGDTGLVTPPTTTPPTGTPTTGDTGALVDTAIVDCPECGGAAELAGDEGGSPCQSGSRAGGLLLVPALLLIARLRRPSR